MTVSTYDFSGSAGAVTSPFTASFGTGLVQDGAGLGYGVNDTSVGSTDTTSLIANSYCKIKHVAGLASGGGAINLYLRLSGTPVSGNGYIAQFNAFAGTFEFLRLDSGAETSIRTAITTTAANGDVLEARMVGNTLSIYRNSSLVGSSNSDTTYASGGNAAILLYQWNEAYSGTKLFIDDWETGDLAGGSVAGLRRSLLGCG